MPHTEQDKLVFDLRQIINRQTDEIEGLRADKIAIREERDVLLDLLRGIKLRGELANVCVGDGYTGGKKPASKDVWAFPRHMLVDLDAALAAPHLETT